MCVQKLILLIACQLLFFAVATAQTLPIDKKATPETRNLYLNLQRLAQKGIMFGHQDDLAYGIGWKYQPGRSDVKEVVGEYPAVVGWDLGHLELKRPVNLDSVPFDAMRRYAQQVYAQGGINTFSWHLNNPRPHQNQLPVCSCRGLKITGIASPFGPFRLLKKMATSSSHCL